MILAANTAVRNDVKFIGYAIESVINHVDEHIVVDTGSTDGTVDILKILEKKYSPKLKVFYEDIGRFDIDIARNKALAETREDADWYFLVDSDECYYKKGCAYIKPFLMMIPQHILAVYLERFQICGPDCDRYQAGRDYRFAQRLFRFKDQILEWRGKWDIQDEALINVTKGVNLLGDFEERACPAL